MCRLVCLLVASLTLHTPIEGQCRRRGATRPEASFEQIASRLMAVHAFRRSPRSGVIGSRHRPTKHWALGGLVAEHGGTLFNRQVNSWEQQPFAVIRPLGKLLPGGRRRRHRRASSSQLINLSAYDSFSLGDIKLGKGDLLVVPSDRVGEVPRGVSYFAYGHGTGLREAVEQAIRQKGGWTTSMKEGKTDGPALVGETDVNALAFMRPLLKRHRHLSFGTHVESLMGDAARFGVIDQALMRPSGHGVTETPELRFYRALVVHQLSYLRGYVEKADLSHRARRGFAAWARRVRGQLRVMDADLELREREGFGLGATQRDQLTDAAIAGGDGKALKAKIAQVSGVSRRGFAERRKGLPNDRVLTATEVELRNAAVEEPTSHNALSSDLAARFLIQTPAAEVDRLIARNPEVFQGFDRARFDLHYAARRTLLIGVTRARHERLFDRLRSAHRVLSRRAPKTRWSGVAHRHALGDKLDNMWTSDRDAELARMGRARDLKVLDRFLDNLSR